MKDKKFKRAAGIPKILFEILMMMLDLAFKEKQKTTPHRLHKHLANKR